MILKSPHPLTGSVPLPATLSLVLAFLLFVETASAYEPVGPGNVVDLSPTISMSHYQNWPGGNLHHRPLVVPYIQHGPGPWASDLLLIDENTATQTDCPPHMMPPQESGMPNANYYGNRQQDIAGATTVQLEMTTDFGKPIAKTESVTLRLQGSKEVIKVGEFVIPGKTQYTNRRSPRKR